MSSLLDIEPDVRDEPITQPAKKWRNKYLCLVGGQCQKTGEIFTAGDTYWAAAVHPSRDVALTVAAEEERKQGDYFRHIDAFPVDDE